MGKGSEETVLVEIHIIIVFFQPFHPSEVIRGHSSTYFVWVRVAVRAGVRARVRVRARVSGVAYGLQLRAAVHMD